MIHHAGAEPPMTNPAPDVAARLRAAGCVFAEDEARLLLDAAATAAELDDLVARRIAGEPLEQILGWAEFAGLRIVVQRGVFVPRRRTELLVREAAALVRRAVAPGHSPVVVDLCCGSGAVAAALLDRLEGIEVHAADIDPAAVRCARTNLAGRGHVYEGDLDGPLPATLRGRVDLLVANAPYVPTEAIGLMPPEARLHEARVALDGGADGVDVQRRIAAAAPGWLAPGGHVLVETGREQVPLTVRAFEGAGLTTRVVRSAELSATVVVGTREA